MLELLGNLLDNACKWAHARVRVEVSEGEGLTLSVEDDGPGVDQDHLAQLQRRGERLDESVAGHGLGLAIAHDIVDFYAGDICFDQSPWLHGLRAQVRLPRHHPHHD